MTTRKMIFFLHLRLIMWKNFTIRRRQKLRCIVDVIWPLVLFVILMVVRSMGLKSYVPECHFEQRALPSSGMAAFLRSILCSLNNTCHSTFLDAQNEYEEANSSRVLLLNLVEYAESLANHENTSIWDNLLNISKDVSEITREIKDVEPTRLAGNIDVSALLPDEKRVKKLVKEAGINLKDETLNVLLKSKVNINAIIWNRRSLNAARCDKLLLAHVLNLPANTTLENIAADLCKMADAEFFRLIVLVISELDATGAWEESIHYFRSLASVQMSWKQWTRLLRKVSHLINELNVSSMQQKINKQLKDFVTQHQEDAQLLQNELNVTKGVAHLLASLHLLCGKSVTVQGLLYSSRMVPLGRFSERIKHLNEGEQNVAYTYDPETSEECNNFFRTLESHLVTRFLWKQLKPFVRGKILYAPARPVTQRIMERVDKNFLGFKQLQVLVNDWSTNVLPQTLDILKYITGNMSYLQTLDGKKFVEAIDTDRHVERAFRWFLLLQETYSQAEEMLKMVVSALDCFEIHKVVPQRDEDAAVAIGSELMEHNKLWAAVIFTNLLEENFDILPPFVIYKIRIDSKNVDDTRFVRDKLQRPGSRSRPTLDMKYMSSGFLYLQDMLERSLIEEQTNNRSMPGLVLQQFPYPCHIYDMFTLAISRTFPLLMILSWVYGCSMLVKAIVAEKECRLTETQRVMGVGDCVLWAGWLLDGLGPNIVTAVLLSCILVFGKVLEHSHVTLVLAFLLTYCAATTTFAFLLSVFFSRANIAAAMGGMIFVLTYLPYASIDLWSYSVTSTIKYSVSLLSNVAFGFGCMYLAAYEELGLGATWDSVSESPIENDTYNLLACMWALLFDSALYMILAWYISNVWPGQYGMPKPLYFPFTRSYWHGVHSKHLEKYNDEKEAAGDHSMGQSSSSTERAQLRTSEVVEESEPEHLVPGIQLQHLTKVFPSGQVAVNDLSITFYQDQITAFLGHNGAGKTTTISMLMGLFPPTSGTAIIQGMDIRQDMSSVRMSLGICPQYNVLYNNLTVEEHLWLYAQMHGQSGEELQNEVANMLAQLELSSKAGTYASHLSGGMKRKLSVATAFVGHCKTVILDEPTAGVDPASRRSIWDLLIRNKRGRTVLLTTHFMDEAELLGDRVAIIVDGQLYCAGSPLFLKAHFGLGYCLTIDMVTQNSSRESSESSPHQSNDLQPSEEPYNSPSKCQVPQRQVTLITNIVKEHVPTAKLLHHRGTELVFVLPERTLTSGYPGMFSSLNQQQEQGVVQSYGICDTSLEEIFLKLPRTHYNKCENKRKHNEPENVKAGSATDEDIRRVPSTNFSLPYNAKCNTPIYFQQFFALILKHLHYTRRSPKAIVSEVLVPPLFVSVALALTLLLPRPGPMPPLSLTPWLYGPPNEVFFSEELQPSPTIRLSMSQYIENLLGPVGMSTRCLLIDSQRDDKCEPRKVSRMINRPDDIRSVYMSCSCKHGSQDCPNGAEGPQPPSAVVSTGDVVYNLTSRNISDWLVKTTSLYEEKRFGGFSFGIQTPLSPLEWNMAQSLLNIFVGNNESETLDSNTSKHNYLKVWFNNKGWATSVAYVNAVNNVILRTLLPADKKSERNKFGIEAINHPMNNTEDQKSNPEHILQRSNIGIVHSLVVLFALSFVPASFLVFLIEERTSKAKHLQIVSGASRIIYWLAEFIWDITCYILAASLCILVFAAFQEQAYMSANNMNAFISLIFLYGWATIPLMYPFSFIFNEPSTAFVFMACSNLFIGMVTTITILMLQLFENERLKIAQIFLRRAFLVFPQYCLCQGMVDLATEHYTALAGASIVGFTKETDILAWEKVGRNLMFMVAIGLVYFIITLAIEVSPTWLIQKIIKRSPPSWGEEGVDDDVLVERQRVLNLTELEMRDHALLLQDLTKMYPRGVLAVNHLCLGVHPGECFGLLGLNGAGKTTTFKMLTGDVMMSGGNAYVAGASVRNQLGEVYQRLGYCPQFDAVNPHLSVKEHLKLYACLRGHTVSQQQQVVKDSLQMLELVHYKNHIASALSGGNRRKLSTALALIGDPRLVFMDEPTTGMDPAARQFLWSCIRGVVAEGRSVVLTSHSMDECEALCSRLTVMARGRLCCLGTTQHLKNKFGHGYIVGVRSTVEQLSEVLSLITARLPGAQLRERHYNQAKLQLPQDSTHLAKVFLCLEEVRSRHLIIDYSVSQTTLEEVFLRFANEDCASAGKL